ncbi:MAG: DUF309 domain-containing protein [Candidatus Dormibacteria bacterium]
MSPAEHQAASSWIPELLPGDPERYRHHPGLERGVELFNEGAFWEAHEAWEEAWMPFRHEDGSNFFKGLIQVAAGCFHYRRKNRKGALIKWRSGADYLRPWLPAAHGLQLALFVQHVDGCREALELAEWASVHLPHLTPAD